MRKRLLFAGELFCFLIFMILMSCTVFAGTTSVSTAAELVNAAKSADATIINVTAPIILDRTVTLDGNTGDVTITGEAITRAPGFTQKMFDLGNSYGYTSGAYQNIWYYDYTKAKLTLQNIVIDGNKSAVSGSMPIIYSVRGGTICLKNAVLKNNDGAVLKASHGGSDMPYSVDFTMEGGAITGNNANWWATGIIVDTGVDDTAQGLYSINHATISDNCGEFRFTKDIAITDSIINDNGGIYLQKENSNNMVSNCTIKNSEIVLEDSGIALTVRGCTLSSGSVSDYVIFSNQDDTSISLKNTTIKGSICEEYDGKGDIHLSGSTYVDASYKIELNSSNGYGHIYVDDRLTSTGAVATVKIGSIETAAEKEFKLIYIPDSSYASIDQFSTGVSGYRFVLGSDHWATVVKDTNPANSSVNAGSGKKQGQVITGGITSKKIKYKAVSKKNQKFQIGAAAKTVVTYKLAGYADKKTSKAKKYFRVASDGTVTVKKGCKKGIYKLRVEMKAAGNATYNAAPVAGRVIKIKVR